MKSAKLLFNFSLNQFKGEYVADQWESDGVTILSIYDNKLLASCYVLSQLFIFDLSGRHLSTVFFNDGDELRDAVLAPRGSLVYTTFYDHKVVVTSEKGKLNITHTQISAPLDLSVSYDGIIYLADEKTGVYQSTNDGRTWTLAFKSADGWQCKQVVTVTTDLLDEFWTIEKSDKLFTEDYHLRVYSVDRKLSIGYVSMRDINVTTAGGKQLNLASSSLSYDGYSNIFISDWYNKAVHVFSVNGQYHFQLLSPRQMKNQPCRLAFDKERHILYVGQSKALVEAFQLTYGEGN